MKRKPTESRQVRDSLGRGGCIHISRNGKPCRYLAVSPETPFCKTHLPPPAPGSPADLADAMEKDGQDFDTPEGVRNVLSILFYALLEGRISERRASILSYIAQGILQSQRAMAQHEKAVAQQKKLAATDSYDRATDAFHKLLLAIPGAGAPGLLSCDDQPPKQHLNRLPNSRPSSVNGKASTSPSKEDSPYSVTSSPTDKSTSASATVSGATARSAARVPTTPSSCTSPTSSPSHAATPAPNEPSSSSISSASPTSSTSHSSAPNPAAPSSSSASSTSLTSSTSLNPGSVFPPPVICDVRANPRSCVHFVPLPRRRNHPAWRGT